MSTLCNLAAIMLVMTLHDQVYAERIYGGHEAVPHSRPYMVLVTKYTGDGTSAYCGGFLLSEDFVMTAAHCYGSSYEVWLGVHDTDKINDDVQRIEVVQSFPHKDFNITGYINDVMLLKLGSKARFNTNVEPIRLADQDGEGVPKHCIVSGWGRVDNQNKGMNTRLMEVNVTLTRDMNCEKHNAYCSKGVDGPREGDSGGPLVCEGTMAYGVVSAFVNSSGHLFYKYTKIPDYKNWIISVIKNH